MLLKEMGCFMKKISSVIEYIEFIFEQTRNKRGKNFYFRGESKKFDYRLPNLYLNKQLTIEGSDYYYNSLLAELGRKTYQNNVELIQVFSELQHYEAKSRLLDITTNPLIALYFATDNVTGAGYVYLFSEKKGEEKFESSHIIAIKSALSLIKQRDIDTFIIIMEMAFKALKNVGYKVRTENGYNNSFLFYSIERLITEVEIEYEKSSRKIFEDDKYLGYPLCDIIGKSNARFYGKLNLLKKEEDIKKHIKDFLCNLVNNFLEELTRISKVNEKLVFPVQIYRDITSSHILLPSKRTDRIRQQQGAFIYPRYVQTTNAPTKKMSRKDIDECYNSVKERIDSSIREMMIGSSEANQDFEYIMIPNEHKKKIRKELSLLGIDEGFIFPDIAHRSRAILDR